MYSYFQRIHDIINDIVKSYKEGMPVSVQAGLEVE